MIIIVCAQSLKLPYINNLATVIPGCEVLSRSLSLSLKFKPRISRYFEILADAFPGGKMGIGEDALDVV